MAAITIKIHYVLPRPPDGLAKRRQNIMKEVT